MSEPRSVNDLSAKLVKAVFDVLRTMPDQQISFSAVCSKVHALLGIKAEIKIKLLLNGLISSGALRGRHGAWVVYQDPSSTSGNDNDKKRSEGRNSGSNTTEANTENKEETKEADASTALREAAMKTALLALQTKLKLKEEELLQEAKKQEQLRAEIEEARQSTRVTAVQLLRGTEEVKVIKGIFHKQFEKILNLAQARMNVFIYGPTGSGKSHICQQVAEALNLRYCFVSCTNGMGEGLLGGRLLPLKKGMQFEYVASEFVDCYENGGLFLLDEMDAADPNVLLLINAALANGKLAVTNRPDKPYAIRHPDFVLVAAANTVGTGADRLYSGRNKLDASTLDRFSIGKVFLDYDPEVEKQLCPDDILRNLLLSYRKKIDGARLERAMSTRFMRDAYIMKSQFGYTIDDINEAYFQGWREDEVNKVKPHQFK